MSLSLLFGLSVAIWFSNWDRSQGTVADGLFCINAADLRDEIHIWRARDYKSTAPPIHQRRWQNWRRLYRSGSNVASSQRLIVPQKLFRCVAFSLGAANVARQQIVRTGKYPWNRSACFMTILRVIVINWDKRLFSTSVDGCCELRNLARRAFLRIDGEEVKATRLACFILINHTKKKEF